MSNKTLEQAIEAAAKEFSFNPPDYDSTAAYSFKYGAIWLSQNLHLLSPSDVAGIPAVNELLCQIDNALDEIAEYQHISEHTHDLLIKACKVFEPKKEGAE